MVEHRTEFITAQIARGVQHLGPMDITDVLLNSAGGFNNVERTFLNAASGHTVSTKVNIHLIAFLVSVEWLAEKVAMLGVTIGVVILPVRAAPKRVNLIVFLKHIECFRHLGDGYKHILDHMLFVIKFLDRGSLGKLKESDGRGKPAKQSTVEGVVSEGDDLLEFPKDRRGPTVVKLAQGDVLNMGLIRG